MFAVIKTGGKQYKVAADNKITVMALPGSVRMRHARPASWQLTEKCGSRRGLALRF